MHHQYVILLVVTILLLGASADMSKYNLRKCNQFLSKKGEEPEVVSLESGLKYKVISSGKGSSPLSTDTVKVHYQGTLINGKEFDSSYKRGTPATFGVTQVISGWTEALQLMKEGDKWELYIPPHLGYGERGVGRDIQGNACLVFTVELLEVVQKSEL